MPQLDIVTFFSQFFWLCIFYVGFYYILYKYFLPQYSRSVLLRDKLTHSSIQGTSIYAEEKGNIEQSLYGYTLSAVGFSKSFFAESKKNTGDWHKLCTKKTNESAWKGANLLYIKSFGRRAASRNLYGNCISYAVGNSLYMESLSELCASARSKGSAQKTSNQKYPTVRQSVTGHAQALSTNANDNNTKTPEKMTAKENQKNSVKAAPSKKRSTPLQSNPRPGTRKSAPSKK